MTSTLPHLTRPDAEMAFIACVLYEPSCLEAADVVELTPDQFYMSKHRAIYDAILSLRESGQAIDHTSVVNELSLRKELEAAGGQAAVYLMGREQPFATEHALTYATQIVRTARLRSLIAYGAELVKRANNTHDSEELLAWAEENLQQMNHRRDAHSMLLGPDTVAFHDKAILAAMEAARQGEPDRYPWPQSWYTWHQHVIPLDAGEVGLIAASTGIGKSTYLEAIAETWAMSGREVVLVHFEDNHRYKLNRRLSRYSGIPLSTLKRGTLTTDDVERKRRTESTIGAWIPRLHYLHTADWSMAQVCRELRVWVDAGRCDAVVVDYLDKAQADERQRKIYGSNVYERQADDMERLKSFVENVGIVAMTATQGNKQMESVSRATRGQIQGSGQKSHKAQLVIVLSRDIVEGADAKALGVNSGSYSPIVTVRIDKQNQGPTLEFRQRFDGPRFRVLDLEESK